LYAHTAAQSNKYTCQELCCVTEWTEVTSLSHLNLQIKLLTKFFHGTITLSVVVEDKSKHDNGFTMLSDRFNESPI